MKITKQQLKQIIKEELSRALSEAEVRSLGYSFIEGGLRGWDSNIAHEVTSQWKKADGLNWLFNGDWNDYLNKRVPGTYNLTARNPNIEILRKAFKSEAIKQAVEAFNKALVDNGIGRELQAKVFWNDQNSANPPPGSDGYDAVHLIFSEVGKV